VDWLAFFAEVIKAAAWPAAVVILVLLFRKPLVELIPLLKNLKYKELELEFGEQIKKVEEEIAQAIPAPAFSEATTTPAPSTEDVALQLASVEPRAGIFQAWREVENAAHEAVARHNIPAASRRLTLMQTLSQNRLVAPEQMAVLNKLNELRNRAVHNSDIPISFETAKEFIEAAGRVAAYLCQV
jgi:hypothetical protein